MSVPCPHGDPFCPCQDGDACHYEGRASWPSPLPAGRPTMRGIALRVCEKYRLSLEDLKGPSAARRFSIPRQEAMHEMYALELWSLLQIGRFLGGRDHTTVLHGVRVHERRLAAERARAET